MRRALEQMRPVPFVCAILTAFAVLIGFDFINTGRVSQEAAGNISRQAASEWVAQNENMVLKALQSSLVGTGVWIGTLKPGALKMDEPPENQDAYHLRVVDFALEQGGVTGRLAVEVDLRTNPASGMKAQVSGAGLHEVTVVATGQKGRVETLFSSSPVTKARVRYYVNAFCSIAWHLVIAGILFGVASLTGLKEKASMAVSLFFASALIIWVSKMDPSWLIGSVSLSAMLVGWTVSEFIRRKRHLEVLRMITG